MNNKNIQNNSMKNENIYNANDTLDINELASLNDDISPEFIEQLQHQVSKNAHEFTGKYFNSDDDTTLFEETTKQDFTTTDINSDANINDNDLEKQTTESNIQSVIKPTEEVETINSEEDQNNTLVVEEETPVENNKIETLTSGTIIEKPIDVEQLKYNESLDFLDENIKYSKYVIYINPENTEFIESLTVKERKNLINRLLKEQDEITLTKRNLGIIQTFLKHIIIAILTIAIAIPVTYWTINASLEASINNYRRSKTYFKTLYKEKGKIKHNKTY